MPGLEQRLQRQDSVLPETLDSADPLCRWARTTLNTLRSTHLLSLSSGMLREPKFKRDPVSHDGETLLGMHGEGYMLAPDRKLDSNLAWKPLRTHRPCWDIWTQCQNSTSWVLSWVWKRVA